MKGLLLILRSEEREMRSILQLQVRSPVSLCGDVLSRHVSRQFHVPRVHLNAVNNKISCQVAQYAPKRKEESRRNR